MAGITPVLLLLAVFVWLGVSPRSSGRWTWLWLLFLIVAVMIFDYFGLIPGSGRY